MLDKHDPTDVMHLPEISLSNPFTRLDPLPLMDPKKKPEAGCAQGRYLNDDLKILDFATCRIKGLFNNRSILNNPHCTRLNETTLKSRKQLKYME